MKILITQAIIASYLQKNTPLIAELPANEAEQHAFVGARLAAVVPYFNDHPQRNEFLITSDDMVFHSPEHQNLANNHVQTLENKVILKVLRSDVAGATQEAGKAEAKAAANGNDYASMNVGQLRELLQERGVTFGEKDNKAKLVQLLLDNPPTAKVEGAGQEAEEEIAITITQEDLDNNPDLVAEGLRVGDTVFVNKKDFVQTPPPPPAPIDYELMNIKELKTVAESKGIIVIKDWTKADIIAAIKATENGTGNVKQTQ